MPTYTYSAFDGAGRQIEGLIDASSEKDAVGALQRQGLLAYQTKPVAPESSWLASFSWRPAERQLRLYEYASFARQLATLVKADLPLDQCLRLVAGQSGRTRLGVFAEKVAQSVTGGRSLSATIEEAAPGAPRFVAPLIRAGEARGSLGPCLNDLATILERDVEVRSRVRSAFVYPGILMLLALMAVGIVLGVLVPTLMPLFRDSGATPPLILDLADTLTTFLGQHWPFVAAGTSIAIAGAAAVLRRPAVRLLISRQVLRMPLLGALVKRINVALLSRTLGTLLHNGVPLVSALALTGSVAPNAEFRSSLMRATEDVKEGSKLTAALRRSAIYPDMALRFVAIGEEASKLDEMLLHLAEVEDANVQRQVENLMTLLTPVITLVIGTFIGGLILSVMQAVMSVNEIAL